jgi:hypothetical protein
VEELMPPRLIRITAKLRRKMLLNGAKTLQVPTASAIGAPVCLDMAGRLNRESIEAWQGLFAGKRLPR